MKTEAKIDLGPFCSTDGYRELLMKPFNWKGWTYATDGRILVRVPLREGLEEHEQKGVEDLCKTLDAERVWKACEIPALGEIKTKPCPTCDGQAHYDSCGHCKGEGDRECSECGEISECKKCEGRGIIPHPNGKTLCESCGGCGVELVSSPVSLGESLFGDVFLKKIRGLPGVRFYVTGQFSPAVFDFDGGSGMLMPRKE